MARIFISFESTSLSEEESDLISSELGKEWVAGVVIFRENIYPDPIETLSHDLRVTPQEHLSFQTTLLNNLGYKRLTPALLRTLTLENISFLANNQRSINTLQVALDKCQQQFDSNKIHQQLISFVNSVLSINPNLLIAIDEEGGYVQRTEHIETLARLPSAKELGIKYEKNKHEGLKELETYALDCVQNLRNIADINFAPCVDIEDEICPIISQLERAFSSNIDTLEICAHKILETFAANGLIGCTKHWPGHGRTEKDTHKRGHVIDRRSAEDILKEAEPYLGIHSPMIMTNHVCYPEFNQEKTDLPACYRKDIIGTLKKSLPDSLIITDCLNMGTLSEFDPTVSNQPSIETLAHRIERSLASGHDIAMLTHQPALVMNKILINLVKKQLNPASPAPLTRMIATAQDNRKTYWKSLPTSTTQPHKTTSTEPNAPTLSIHS
ncbi:MAG TPA: glycoside hydrolase family 3 N-terminal domain-containing protein [Gammaproteobacteria bacterium]|nr:glycoside hydrolase family 3 N-terminal domain-containing protein [Gammaproteobacteria bacterium]